jgi:hypothetical protein
MPPPLPYATPAPPRSKHDTVYTVLLGVTTFRVRFCWSAFSCPPAASG